MALWGDRAVLLLVWPPVRRVGWLQRVAGRAGLPRRFLQVTAGGMDWCSWGLGTAWG